MAKCKCIKTGRLRILAISLLLFTATASAQDYDPRWYGGIYGGWVSWDSNRHVHDDTNAGFGGGRFFSPRISIDLEFESTNTHFDVDYIEERGLQGAQGQSRAKDLHLTGRYYFTGSGFRPYVLLGLGVQRHRALFGNGEYLAGTLGLGVYHGLGNRVFVRAQAATRYVNDDKMDPGVSNYTNIVYRLDLMVLFGKNSAQ